MTQAVLGRWGKNLAVRFSHDIESKLGLREGETLDIETTPDQIIVRRIAPAVTADQLFAGKSPGEWRALYQDAYAWGPDIGQEIIEE